MRLVKILTVALGLMTIVASAGFANVPFVTTSTLNQMAVNAQTGLSGNVQFTALTGGVVSQNEIVSVIYGATISNVLDLKVNAIVGGVPCAAPPGQGFTAYGTAPGTPLGACNISAFVTSQTVVFTFSQNVTFSQGDYLQVNGARLNVSGFATVGGSLSVTVTSVLGTATVTSPSAQIAVFVEPLATPTVSDTVSFDQDGVANTAVSTVEVTEAFPNAFETNSQTFPTQLILQITNIPTGLKLLSASNVTGSATVTAVLDAANTDIAHGKVVIKINAQNASELEHIDVDLTYASTSTNIPLNPGSATITATLGPPASGTAPYPFPLRYLAHFVSVNQGFEVLPLISGLLAEFNVVAPGQFDTGIAIANLSGTDDNIVVHSGLQGTITVSLYPMDGSGPVSFTTSATKKPGIGLDSQGRLVSKGTWAVLVSELLTTAGVTSGSFEGYIVFTANFPNAMGVNFIADPDFAVQSQGYAMVPVSFKPAD